jgi:hypothetical protein
MKYKEEKTMDVKKFRLSTECAKTPAEARKVVKELYLKKLDACLTKDLVEVTKDDWCDKMDKAKMFFCPLQVQEGQWNLKITRQSYSATPEAAKVWCEFRHKNGIYERKIKRYYWVPRGEWNEETQEYDHEYYTQETLPFWKAIKYLLDAPGDTTKAIAEKFRTAYYLYEEAYESSNLGNSLAFNAAALELMHTAVQEYTEAASMLYEYNASFRNIPKDIKIQCRELDFEEYLKTTEPVKYTDLQWIKALYAVVFFDCGYTTKELTEIINRHPDVYTFLEYCNVPELGIAGETEFGTPIYHKAQPGVKYPVFTCVGRKNIDILKDVNVPQLAKCYDYFVSLPEEERIHFRRVWVNDHNMKRIVKTWDTYMESLYPHPEFDVVEEPSYTEYADEDSGDEDSWIEEMYNDYDDEVSEYEDESYWDDDDDDDDIEIIVTIPDEEE